MQVVRPVRFRTDDELLWRIERIATAEGMGFSTVMKRLARAALGEKNEEELAYLRNARRRERRRLRLLAAVRVDVDEREVLSCPACGEDAGLRTFPEGRWDCTFCDSAGMFDPETA